MDNIIMLINIYLPLDKESNSTLDTGHWTVTEFSRREKISMCLVPGGCWWLLVRLCKGARYVTLNITPAVTQYSGLQSSRVLFQPLQI